MSTRRAFSLVELLVVIGIVAVLIGILMPTLRKARLAAQQTVCASNLRQVGAGLLLYVNDYDQRLPYIVEPYWESYSSTGAVNLNVDPTDPAATPYSFTVVMKKYLGDGRVLICPSANVGFPAADPKMTYRVSAANNSNGRVQLYDELVRGNDIYFYSLKYLNGRRYELLHVNPYVLPFKIEKGVGSHYLARDMIRKWGPSEPRPPGSLHGGEPPHPNRQYNQLRLDLSVTLERDDGFDVSTP